MTARGETIDLIGQFESAGGTPVDATDVELNIYNGDDLIAGPFDTFTHPVVGVYGFEWTVPLDAPVGTYLAIWSGVLPGDTQPTTGIETFEVTSFYTAPGFTGCLWPIDTACLDDEWDTYTEEVKSRAVALASSSLHRLTGRRVGGCPVKVRPILDSAQGCWFHPYVDSAGQWRNRYNPNALFSPKEVPLPAPVGRIDEVKVNGDVVSPGDYEVQGTQIGPVLIWTGAGDPPWPRNQDMSKPDTEDGTFSITYLNSYPVDSHGALAAGMLAMEFARACVNASKCKLPKTVTNMVRRGVSYEIRPGLFPDGKTGIREVDGFTELWNPKGRRGTVIWSPDIDDVRVVR